MKLILNAWGNEQIQMFRHIEKVSGLNIESKFHVSPMKYMYFCFVIRYMYRWEIHSAFQFLRKIWSLCDHAQGLWILLRPRCLDTFFPLLAPLPLSASSFFFKSNEHCSWPEPAFGPNTYIVTSVGEIDWAVCEV